MSNDGYRNQYKLGSMSELLETIAKYMCSDCGVHVEGTACDSEELCLNEYMRVAKAIHKLHIAPLEELLGEYHQVLEELAIIMEGIRAGVFHPNDDTLRPTRELLNRINTTDEPEL